MSDLFALFCFCGISVSWGEAGACARKWRSARGYDTKRAKYYRSICLWATTAGAAFAMAVWANIDKQNEVEKAKQKYKIETVQQPANPQTNAATLQWKDAVQKTR